MNKINQKLNNKNDNGAESLIFGIQQHYPWILKKFPFDSPIYNISIALRISGVFKQDSLEKKIFDCLTKHPILATTLMNDGVSTIGSSDQIAKTCFEFKKVSDNATFNLNEELNRIAQTPFKVENTLIKIFLWETAVNEHILLVLSHRLIIDDSAMEFFIQELIGKQDSALTPYTVPLNIETKPEYFEFWKDYLKGELPTLQFPSDNTRKPVFNHKGKKCNFKLPGELVNQLKHIASDQQVSMKSLLLASFNVLLFRYSNQEDILVGVSGKRLNSREIGPCGKTNAIRSFPSVMKIFRDYLSEIQNLENELESNETLSLDQIEHAIDYSEDASVTPLFQAIFEILPAVDLNRNDLSISRVSIENDMVLTDIHMRIYQTDNELWGMFAYSNVLNSDQASGFVKHFTNVLCSVCDNLNAPLGKLAILDVKDKEKLLYQLNQTEVLYNANECAHHMFEKMANSDPSQIAVQFEDSQWTYEELNQRSNQIAHSLIKQGVSSDVLVAVFVHRSLEMMATLLGILKAGGAYIPLDPTHPPERIQMILEDANPAAIVSCPELVAQLNIDRFVLNVHNEADVWKSNEITNPNVVISPEQLAYIIFTSGSTGRPKGVQIQHRGLSNLLVSMKREPGIQKTDNVLAITTISFDMSTPELYLALVTGATMFVADKDTSRNPLKIEKILNEKDITFMQGTSSTWQMLLDAGWSGKSDLKIGIGGEAVPADLLSNLSKKAGEIWVLYGPTETTVWSTTEKVIDGRNPAIGKPMNNTQVYVLNSLLEPVPMGVAGELCIGGDGLARGYHGRTDLTDEQFVQNPFIKNTRIYKTGDLARFLPDGRLECLGRTDFQVKIRGFRIELNEIEELLSRIEGIKAAVVHPQLDHINQKVLVGYVVFEGNSINTNKLKSKLKKKLPEYMIPSFILELDKLPFTPNGKIARKELPIPDFSNVQRSSEYEVPQTEREKELVSIWQDALGIDKIGINDRFDDVGGDSLTAIKVIVKMQRLGIDERICRGIFQGKTISEISRIEKSALSNSDTDHINKPKAIPSFDITAKTNLMINVTRGILIFMVVFDHWLPGILKRLPDVVSTYHPYLYPLLNLITPGFAIIFGVSLGYIYYPMYLKDPKRVKRVLRFGGFMILIGVIIRSSFQLLDYYLTFGVMDSTIFFNSYYSALLYYFLAIITAQWWFKWMTFFKNEILACAVLAVFSYLVFRITHYFIYHIEFTGFIQLIKLIFVTKFSYFNMSVGAIGGIAIGFHIKKNYKRLELSGFYCKAGSVFMAAGAILAYFTSSFIDWFDSTGEIFHWIWIFYGGAIMFMIAGINWLLKYYESMSSQLREFTHIVGILGQCVLPIFILHGIILDIKDLFDIFKITELLSFPIILIGFFSFCYIMMKKIYDLFYGTLD